MKIIFSLLACLSINLCLAQVDYREITNYLELKSLQSQIEDFSYEISCDSCHMMAIANPENTDLKFTCMEETEGGMLVFGKEYNKIFDADNKAFIQKVLFNEFEGKLELQSFRVSSTAEFTLLYITYYPQPNTLPQPKAFLYQRKEKATE
jgi:hypothetical protein